MKTIDQHGVHRLIDGGAQLIEVLPSPEYEQEHISGAANIPLKALTPEAVARFDSSQDLIVYCHDYL